MTGETGIQSINKIAGVGILGTGSGFADDRGRWISNEDIHLMLYGRDWKKVFEANGRDPDYYRKKYGFDRRYWVHTPGCDLAKTSTTSLDLSELAARNAMESAGINTDEIDLVIVFSTTSPKYTSSIATALTGRLGLKCAAFEIKSGCSSALYAMSVAYQFISAGARNVLIAGGDTLTKVTSPDSPFLYAIGDGAGAVVLGRVDRKESGLEAIYLDSDGSYSESMGVPGILPPTIDALKRGDYFMNIDTCSQEFIRDLWKEVPRKLIEISGISAGSIDYFVSHQVNRELIEIGGRASGLSVDRIADFVGEYGNCGPSGVLIALDRLFREKRIGSSDRLMLCAVGGGIAWAGLILRV